MGFTVTDFLMFVGLIFCKLSKQSEIDELKWFNTLAKLMNRHSSLAFLQFSNQEKQVIDDSEQSLVYFLQVAHAISPKCV